MTATDIYTLEIDAPDDTSALETLIERGEIDPTNVLGILGKTEGNGCVNDFSRGLATMAYERLLAGYLDIDPPSVTDRVALIMSGGTEGVLTPHVTVFVRRESGARASDGKRLTAARASTRAFEPSEIGRHEQIRETAAAVERAMSRARITDGSDVHYVQVKCPLLTAEDVSTARERDESVVTADTYESMGYSRGASALGVALATGELSEKVVQQTTVCSDPEVYSTVASTSAGSELHESEILLLGNSAAATGDLAVGHAVMDDALDSDAVAAAAGDVGVSLPEDQHRIRNAFVKAQASSDGSIRGRRHVIHNDSDINATRHARAVVSSVVGAAIGDPLCYTSGGAEHQGPDGGGPVAVIAEVNE
jgi:cyanuric acid amidohydrolase